MLRPLRRRDFALLWGGLTISMLGDGIYLVALPFLVLRILNEPGALSAVGVAWTLPTVLLLIAGGVVTDRYDRRRVLIASDVTRGLAITAVGILAISGDLELVHLLGLVAVYGAGEAFFGPAFGAIVPDVVHRDLLPEANALNQFSRPLAFRLVGPALGGLLVAGFGVGTAMLVDAATFGVSALAVAAMRTRRSVATERKSAISEVTAGLRFVRSQAWLWAGLGAAALGLLAFYGPFEALVPFRVKNTLGGNAGDFGLIVAFGGLGSILGSMVMGQRGLPRHHITVAFLGWGVGTLAVGLFALTESIPLAMVISFGMGICFTVGQIIWGTLMHTHVPGELLGRVSALDWLVSTAFVPVSFALTGPAASTFGVDKTLLGAGVLGAIVVMGFLLVPGVRALEGAPRLAAADPV